MKKFSATLYILIVISALIITGCNNTPSQSSEKKLKVVTSFYPSYEIVKTLGGDKIETINLTQPGVEPHDYELTPQDFISLHNADLLIVNGGGLEPWLEKIDTELQEKKIKVINLSEFLKDSLIKESSYKASDHNHNHTGEHDLYDPHFWLDPIYYSTEVSYIAEQIGELDPINKDYYLSQAEIYKSQILEIHSQYEQNLRNCHQNSIITNHAAFNYLGRRYHFNIITISGISPEAEPSGKKLAELTKIVKEKNIRYIFTESLLSPKIAETLANETGTVTSTLNPIENLTAEESEQHQTYLSIMQKNLEKLKTALECES